MKTQRSEGQWRGGRIKEFSILVGQWIVKVMEWDGKIGGGGWRVGWNSNDGGVKSVSTSSPWEWVVGAEEVEDLKGQGTKKIIGIEILKN